MQNYLTVAETATRLKVCPQTVYTLVRKGQLPHVRCGRAIRIPDDAYIRELKEWTPWTVMEDHLA